MAATAELVVPRSIPTTCTLDFGAYQPRSCWLGSARLCIQALTFSARTETASPRRVTLARLRLEEATGAPGTAWPRSEDICAATIRRVSRLCWSFLDYWVGLYSNKRRKICKYDTVGCAVDYMTAKARNWKVLVIPGAACQPLPPCRLMAGVDETFPATVCFNQHHVSRGALDLRRLRWVLL